MKFLALFALFVVAAAQDMLFDPDLNEPWENFKRVFGKSYKGKEEVVRRLIWEKHVNNVTQHNLKYDLDLISYREGINEFSDMDHQDFVRTLNGYLHQTDNSSKGSTWVPPSNVQLPSWVDWRAQGLVTAVKNQKNCGSCWAFSATGSLEGQHMKKTRQLMPLSEQNLVDCSRGEGNKGCAGGWMGWAFEYIRKNNGIDTEGSYPYTARDGPCQFKRYAVGAKVSGQVSVQRGSEWALQQAVATVGPISVAIDAGHYSFQNYKNGVYYEPACNPNKLNHAVLVVGYGSEGGRDYWLVKNSWGTSWGMSGYIKMARNKNNNCGIASAAVFPLV